MTKTIFFLAFLGVIFVVAVGVFLARTFPENTAPFITATANLIGITVSASIIIWQASKQYRNILNQQEWKIRDEFKLEIYRELDKSINKAVLSLVDANGIIQTVMANLSIAFFNENELGLPYKPIKERAKNIYEPHFQATADLNQITFDIERYEIALPEVKTVRLAFFEKEEELNKKYNKFFIEVLKFIPHDVPDNEQATIGKTVTGHKISIDDIERLKGLAQNYSECTAELHVYISDLQVILQNSLLGHLFDRELPHRRKPGSTPPLLKTDDTAPMKKLKTQLLQTGVWGKILTRKTDC